MRCKYCYNKTIKSGYRYNTRGKVQRYKCKSCNKKSSNYGRYTYRMRNRRWKILEAIKLRKQGLSYAEIASKLGEISRQSVFRWMKKQ